MKIFITPIPKYINTKENGRKINLDIISAAFIIKDIPIIVNNIPIINEIMSLIGLKILVAVFSILKYVSKFFFILSCGIFLGGKNDAIPIIKVDIEIGYPIIIFNIICLFLVKKYIAVVLNNIAIIPKKLNLIFVKKSSPNIIPVEENSNPKIVKSISLFLIPKYVDKIPKPKNAITNINKKIDIGLIFKLLL